MMAGVTVPLSILDLAVIGRGETARDGLQSTVAMARAAERCGYTRVWYAEHHNMRSIASSATAVLIAHVAAHTETIRLGSGGVMLPNHSPLAIAEQFGTLESLHPGRIDLGLGRAPGTDQVTTYALRRDPRAADTFPHDVQELQAYLAGESLVAGVEAIPGRGTNVPLYILGSSLFGATLAAALGLPFGFASHFAPDALEQAVAIYRQEFQPSEQLERPHVIAGVNVIAADTTAAAEGHLLASRRRRAASMLARGRQCTDEEADALLASPQGQGLQRMFRCTAVGTPSAVREQLEGFVRQADADELITVHHAPTIADRIRSAELLAEAWPGGA
jgi:luciferase family oxidoreductase group 1